MDKVWVVVRDEFVTPGYDSVETEQVVCVYPDQDVAEQHATFANKALIAYDEAPVGERRATLKTLRTFDPEVRPNTSDSSVDGYRVICVPFRLHVDEYVEKLP